MDLNMTDKQRILSEIEGKYNEWKLGNSVEAKYRCEAYKELIELIKPIQEEPVSSIWHNASEKSNKAEDVVVINPFDNTGEVLTGCIKVYQGRIWAYTSVLLNLDNSCKIGKNLQEEPISKVLDTESMIEAHKQKLISQVNGMKDSPFVNMCLDSYKQGINEILDTLNLSNAQTIEATIGYFNHSGLSIDAKLPKDLKEGSKCKLIIIKDK